jgi:hypothetical protein
VLTARPREAPTQSRNARRLADAARPARGQEATPAFRGGAFEGGADEATVEDVVRWGSTGGGVLGLDGLQGLQVGQQADIALYRLDDPRYFGLHDPAIGPVASGGRPFRRQCGSGAVPWSVMTPSRRGSGRTRRAGEEQAVKKMLEGN